MTGPSVPRAKFRVALVEDHALFAESLELALSVEGYDVKRIPLDPEAVSQASLINAVLRARPRVVLLDFDLGRTGDGVHLIGPLVKENINVVIVTASTEATRWGQALWHGARAVLPKSRPLNDILGAVRRLHHGQAVLDVSERERLIGLWRTHRAEMGALGERMERLTHRESEVLGHLMLGHTVHEIAAVSVVSEATVRTQVKSILAKLEVSSQIAAVGLAHRVGWTPPPV
ncbi:response regulator transcription factor [Nocardioides insulae]|uniref:response regulator transcription factor n=1 Tax=Nocardioides insulae TaxID=394734 RepID=UPI0003FD4A2E|nr:response regulator transcription factor [Nocardioides insulae]